MGKRRSRRSIKSSVKTAPKMTYFNCSEWLFEVLAEHNGWQWEHASEMEDMTKHWDYRITSGGLCFKIDVKGRKKRSRQDNQYDDSLLWIEFKNVYGKPGWISGDADLIAFETENHFNFVHRQKIKQYVGEHFSGALFITPTNTPYQFYQRRYRQDKIGFIPFDDITGMIFMRWDKNA